VSSEAAKREIADPGSDSGRSRDALRPLPAEVSETPLTAPPAPTRVRSGLLTGMFTLAVFYTMYFAKALLIPIVLALLFNLLLAPIVRVMRSWLRVPEGLGAALVLLLLIGSVGAAFYGLSGPAALWLDELPVAMSDIERKIRPFKEPVETMQEAAQQVEQAAQGATDPAGSSGADGPAPVEVVVQTPSLTQSLLSGTATLTAGLLVTVVLLYFLLASGDTLLRQAVTIAPRLRDKKRVVEIVREMEDDVSYYLLTISMINGGLGVAVGLTMLVLGMPNPILWGVMAAIFNFVPYLGALIGIGIVGLVAVLNFEAPLMIVLPPLAYFCLTTIEGYFVTPGVLARRLTLNPVAVFLTLMVLAWMWGTAGALLAVPMLATFKICCDHVEALQPIGTMLGR
jgi:predicted PurR-regulated permease PerM